VPTAVDEFSQPEDRGTLVAGFLAGNGNSDLATRIELDPDRLHLAIDTILEADRERVALERVALERVALVEIARLSLTEGTVYRHTSRNGRPEWWTQFRWTGGLNPVTLQLVHIL
jgi:hypothetical protein